VRHIATMIDGIWVQEVVVDGHHQVANPSMDEVDHVVTLLGEVVMRAQSMSPDDLRRVRDFVHAASAVLMSTTYLPRDDQVIFETALRTSVARK
jgi:hypothetical protein